MVEVIISLVIFSAVILGLAGLAFQVAKRSTRATDQALLMSVLLAKVDKVATVPFDIGIIASHPFRRTGRRTGPGRPASQR